MNFGDPLSLRQPEQPAQLRHTPCIVLAERADLQQRRHALGVTKRVFDLWHVFHLPLVWIMFAIVTLHVGVALYLGYVPFRW